MMSFVDVNPKIEFDALETRIFILLPQNKEDTSNKHFMLHRIAHAGEYA